ncbi:MAG TPA: acetyl-CoA carboxylase biotin carboxyl carrier protein [Catalimonadaceae bacterium]|nr:acetyl-CoA carboxylase biotin carboxyl carrier protein [Catalimonadaceae bacterium]
MKPSEIKDLIDFIDKSNLDEVNIETENFKISARKNATKTIVEQVITTAAPVQNAPVARVESAAPVAAPAPAPAPAEPAGKKLVEIKSPMIGTLYRSASPDKPFFVNVGDEVKVGQTVCIIEAMKLFNEIESDVNGRIVKISIENASPVEFDQVLFLVEPA